MTVPGSLEVVSTGQLSRGAFGPLLPRHAPSCEWISWPWTVTLSSGWLYPKSNPTGWAFRFEFWNSQAQEPFEERIVPMSIKLGCPSNPLFEPLVSSQGYQFCYESGGFSVSFYYSGNVEYLFDLAIPGNLPVGDDKEFLIGVMNSLQPKSP